MKKAIIIQHSGRLANQLWNFISIYAYCLLRGYDCENYAFFDYRKYFNMPVKNRALDMLLFKPIALADRVFPERAAQRLKRKVFSFYVRYISKRHGKHILYSSEWIRDGGAFFLPPSETSLAKDRERLLMLENNPNVKNLYFSGWLFRNPVGIKRYRSQILDYFKPRREVQKSVDDFIAPLRQSYKHIVGVHIRQTDYRVSKGGIFFVEQNRAREIIDEYISYFGKNPKETCFVICSDGSVDRQTFRGINFVVSGKDAVEDLFILGSCDIILGSDSTYGGFSSYWANIPHIVFKRNKIDWDYYKDKTQYFENKYCLTLATSSERWKGIETELL